MATEAPTQKSWMTWTGRVLSGIVVLMLSFSAFMKLQAGPEVVEAFVNVMGYPAAALGIIGILELASALLYAIPKTSVFGAILLTGYLGGAIATHVRMADGQFYNALIVGIVVWAALFLRDARLRALLPLVSKN